MPRRSNQQPHPNPKYANDAEISNLESNETFSIDSNGPSQTVKMPASNIKAQLTKNFSNICELFHPIIHKS